VAEKITSEKQAKRLQEEAMAMLAEVRQWVWEKGTATLPKDPEALVPRHSAEWHAAYRVWFFTVRDAMHMMDPGWDEEKLAQIPKPGGT
jgi:hypothetical protein